MKRFKKFTWILLVLLLIWQVLLFKYLPNWEDFGHYYNLFFEFKRTVQDTIFGLFSFSVGDVIYAVLALLILLFTISFGVDIFNQNRKRIGEKINRILIFLNVSFLMYSLFWGFSYNQHNYPEYKIENVSESELKSYAEKYLKKCIQLRQSFPENRPFQLSLNEHQLVEENLLDSIKIKNVKKSMYSEPLNYLGILGYFNPFTGEAQYNYKIPHSKIPFTIGHEMAHQNGIAPEDEASMQSFINGIESTQKEIQYATNYKALRGLLATIYITDSVYVNQKIKQYSKGMEMDRQANITYAKQYGFYSQEAFANLNDAFLKANGEDGIDSYSDFVKLLIGYERKKQEDTK